MGSLADRKVDWRDVFTGQVREIWQRYPEAKKALEEWVNWTHVDRGGPVLALTSIYDSSNMEEWALEGEIGLTGEQLAARKRSEPLMEIGYDPVGHAVDKRLAEMIDEWLHQPSTPTIWRAVAFSFLTRAPEYEMPWLAGVYLRRLSPTRGSPSDEAFITAMDSLMGYIDDLLTLSQRR